MNNECCMLAVACFSGCPRSEAWSNQANIGDIYACLCLEGSLCRAVDMVFKQVLFGHNMGLNLLYGPHGGQDLGGDSCPPTIVEVVPLLKLLATSQIDVLFSICILNQPPKHNLKVKPVHRFKSRPRPLNSDSLRGRGQNGCQKH